jgi:hypothetical protein
MSESKPELTSEQRGELLMLGEQLGKVYGQKVKGFQDLYKAYPNDEWIQEHYAPDKLHAEAARPISDGALDILKREAATNIRWDDLQAIAERDHSEAVEVWESIKRAAIDYLSSGQFGVDCAGRDETPFERGIVAGIRNRFVEAWKPKDAIEMGMVEMLVQAFISYHRWLMAANVMANREYEAAKKSEKDRYGEYGRWDTPRLDAAEAIDRALVMADRFNKLFLRTLRQMRDLRRYASPVTINNPKQVNIAAEGGQQNNVQKAVVRKKKSKKAASTSARPALKIASKT